MQERYFKGRLENAEIHDKRESTEGITEREGENEGFGI